MSARHRDRGFRTGTEMRWIGLDGSLMRAKGTVVPREYYGLPPITVRTGPVWRTENGNG